MGNAIGTSDDANGACLFDLPSLVHIVCLTADGGTSGNPMDFEAAVLRAVIGGDQGLTARIADADGTRAAGNGAAVGVLAAAAGEAPRADTLPFTGGRAWISLIGLALLAAAAFTYRMRGAL